MSSLEEGVLFLFWATFSGGMSLRKTVWPPAEPHLLVISAAFRIFSFVSLESTVSLVIGDLSLLDDCLIGWAPIICSCSSMIPRSPIVSLPRLIRSLFRALSCRLISVRLWNFKDGGG